jgi:hypothetical protein
MSTSNSYVFGTTTQIDAFFREAFERIGIIGNKETLPMISSAVMSANLALSEWMGKGPNSWMRKRGMITLYANQPTYQLPTNITQLVDSIAIQPNVLNTGGTAGSSTVASGSPANVFNPASTAGCTLADPNGFFSYDYGAGNSNSITYIGIAPLQNNQNYTIAVDYSFDNVNWITIYNGKTQNYNSNQVEWIVISNSLNARAWRIRETGGATLGIQQLYFSQPAYNGPGDRAMTSLSYTEWMQLANKMTPGIPTAYFFDMQINPTITLWNVPNQSYISPAPITAILYSAYFYPQDITNLFNQFDVPQRFFEALVSEVAYRLAAKFALADVNLLARLGQEKDQKFKQAAIGTDYTNVSLSFRPDFSYLGR